MTIKIVPQTIKATNNPPNITVNIKHNPPYK